jgi:hypothetical protein
MTLMSLGVLGCRAPVRAVVGSSVGPSVGSSVPVVASARPRVDAERDAGEARWTASAPEQNPRLFSGAQRLDVDEDGRPDLVLSLPSVGAAAVEPDMRVPSVVWLAHGHARGGFVREDALTRAALRAACPEAPHLPLTFSREAFEAYESGDEGSDAQRHRARATIVLLTGVCALAWGASLEQLERSLAPTRADALGLTAAGLTEVRDALRAVQIPLRLTPRALPPLPSAEVTAPALTGTAPNLAASEPGTGPVCARIREENRREFERARRAARLPVDVGAAENPLPYCAQRGGQGWAVRVRDARYDREQQDDPVLRFQWELVALGRDGVVRARGPRFEGESSDMADLRVEIGAVFDWDGDGELDVAVRRSEWHHESPSECTYSLFALRGGRVVAYELPDALRTIREVEDVDRDGRPDLILPTRWSFVDACGMNGIEHAGPSLLAHARADGTFSQADDVARAFAQAECERSAGGVGSAARGDGGAATEPSEPMSEEDVLVSALACGRIRGADPESLVAWARQQPALRELAPTHLRESQEFCFGFSTLAALALVAPPFEPLPPGGVPPLPPRPARPAAVVGP